jgi:hypothetical protein
LARRAAFSGPRPGEFLAPAAVRVTKKAPASTAIRWPTPLSSQRSIGDCFRDHSGRLPPTEMQAILRGVDTLLGP